MRKICFLYCLAIFIHLDAEAQVASEGDHTETAFDTAYKKRAQPFWLVPYGSIRYLLIPASLKISRRKNYALPVKDGEKSFLPMKPGKCFWLSTREAVVGYGLFLSILVASPPKFTKWDHYFGKELLQNAGKRFRSAWTSPPVWDHDLFITNYIGHPYGGSFYYNSRRTKGRSAVASFCFSVLPQRCGNTCRRLFLNSPAFRI